MDHIIFFVRDKCSHGIAYNITCVMCGRLRETDGLTLLEMIKNSAAVMARACLVILMAVWLVAIFVYLILELLIALGVWSPPA